MKKCFKCGRTKAIDLFYPHPQMGDGHLNKCKACTKRDVKENYYKNFEKIQAYEKARFQTPHRKKKVYEYANKRKKRNPGKVRARGKVMAALKNGYLVRKPCEVCKETKVQAHHTDYRKPLFIKWLCFIHHRQEHGQLKHQ